MKQYMSNGINSSPTISVTISDTALTDGKIAELGGKVVKFDDNGELVLCSTAGEKALGIVTIDNDVEVKSGDEVSVQIKDNGVARISADVKAGDELATDADGKLAGAAAGDYVRAIALTNGIADTIIRVMMVNYVKSASASTTSDDTSTN